MNKKAFTLVELIVVITILTILWTIAFLSFQWYTKSARDSVRISDLKNIEKALWIYKIKTWEYPEPSWDEEVEYDLKEVWTQWTVGQSVITNLDKLNKVPRDPLTWSEYTYSRLNTKKELQLACILEWSPVALIKNEEIRTLFSIIPAEAGIYKNNFIPQANAADVKTTATAYVTWDYNWQIAKVNSWSTTYILAVPSIINWDMTLTDIIEVISNKKLVYNWYANLPSSYTWTIFEINWWFDYSQTWWIVVYSWSIEDLKTDEDARLSLISNLQEVYSWTILENTWNIKQLIDTEINLNTPTDEAKTLACWTIDFWLWITTIIEWCQDKQIETLEDINSCKWGWVDYNTTINNYWWFYNSQEYPILTAFAVLKEDGSVVTWGSNTNGWDSSSVSQYLQSWVTQITATNSTFAALKDNWSIILWWNDSSWWNPSTEVRNLISSWVSKIYSTESAFAALKEDGSVVTWGSNTNGWDSSSVSQYLQSWVLNIYSNLRAFVALKDDWSAVVWWHWSYWWAPNTQIKSKLTSWVSEIYSTKSAFAVLKKDWSLVTWWTYWWDSSSVGQYLQSWVSKVYSTDTAFAALKDDWSVITWWYPTHWWDSSNVSEYLQSWVSKVYSTQDAFAALKDDWSVITWGNYWWNSSSVSQYLQSWVSKIYSTPRAFSALKSDWSVISWWVASYWWDIQYNNSLYGELNSWVSKIYSTMGAFTALKSSWKAISWWNGNYWWYTSDTIKNQLESDVYMIFSNRDSFTAIKEDGTIVSWWWPSTWWNPSESVKSLLGSWSIVSINWVCVDN